VKTITPQAPIRTALRTGYSRDDSQTTVRINHKPFPQLTVEERCTVLAQIAQLFRDMAEQAEEERRLLALEELSA